MVILEFKNVYAGYGKKNVLMDINFKLQKGSFTGIIGPNGSGKSTILKVATRVLKKNSGTVLFNEVEIEEIPLKDFATGISYLPSDIGIAYPYSVNELLLMARYPFHPGLRSSTEKDSQIIKSIAEKMDLIHLLEKSIFQLSEGEKQRVLLAQCLVQQPELIILDEPTSHLDIGYQFSFLDLLKSLQRDTELSILMVLHDLNLASQYCDFLVLLDSGKIVKSGTPHEVLKYEILEQVYKTNLLVYQHPLSKKPYVFGVPSEWKNLTEK